MNTDMQVIKVAPGAEPEKVTMDIPEVAQVIGGGKWRCGPFRPFGSMFLIYCAIAPATTSSHSTVSSLTATDKKPSVHTAQF